MDWSLSESIAVFIAAGLVIAVIGYFFTAITDRIADRTGIGEALAGGVLLGATTSLPDTAVTLTAAWHGAPDLAVSNALGGIAAQTVFLAVADLVYRRSNLEHAAASLPNLIYGVVLLALLVIPIMAHAAPELAIAGIHPVSPLLLIFYWYGVKLVRGAHQRPMWLPRRTRHTREDAPQEPDPNESLAMLWIRFFALAPILAGTGWALATAAERLVEETGLSSAFVGGLFTAVATSLPELVVAVSAVRQGALTLAVGNILGGNAFDALQLPLADIVYRGEASVYQAFGRGALFLAALCATMTTALILGLLRRQEKGLANIGSEGMALLALYGGGMWILYLL